MASQWTAYTFEHNFPYQFRNPALLRKAFIAGDTNSHDREGHRGMSQLGDALLSFVITSEGYDRGISRQEQQERVSVLKSKRKCSTLARIHSIDKFVQISERQIKDGPQPTTLKNTLTAIVAAVWLDSRDYHASVQVMAFLGLVNCAEPSASRQDVIVRESTLASPTEFAGSSRAFEEIDRTVNDSNMNAFLDCDVFETDWMFNVSQVNIPGNWLAEDASQSLVPVLQLDQHIMESEAQVVFEDWLTQDSPTDAPDQSTQDAGRSVEQHVNYPDSETSQGEYRSYHILRELTPEASSTASPYRGDSNDGAMDIRIDPICPSTSSQPYRRWRAGLASARGDDSKRHRDSRSQGIVHGLFKAYIDREAEKLKSRPELFTPHYNHMKPYQEALISITTSHPKALATMAIAIGDCSAMLLFKQAIENIRSPSDCILFDIGRSLSHEQRLKAIYRLDLCMAHTRLARWLHIYKLYEDMSHKAGGKYADGFVVLTNADLEQDSNRSHASARRGNPRNLEQSAITRRMRDCVDMDGRGSVLLDGTQNSTKRLRRIGRRLHMFVLRWDLGVLSLLDTTFTDELIMSVTDAVFLQFIKTVDRFEGRSIRALSVAATPTIKLFMENDVILPKLRIEAMEQDLIQQLPRLSQDMQQLFLSEEGF